MVYGDITSSTAAATAFNCPQIGYSSANGTLPFLPNDQPPQFYPTNPLTNGYNLPNRNSFPNQLIHPISFDFNNQYGNYPTPQSNSQTYPVPRLAENMNQSDGVLDEGPVVLPSTSQQPINDPCAHLVQVLLCYHQGGEDPEFIRKAIESLVKKLKDKRTELDSLISAVTSGGKQATGCVTIHRSLDGRLQVAGRKGVPHVVYARIWRWPNVSKNELQKMPICTTPTDHSDLICINPFHYDRVVSSALSNMHPIRMDSFNNSFDQQQSNTNDFSEIDDFLQFNSTNGPNSSMSQNVPVERKEANNSMPFLMYGPHQQPSYVVSHLSCGSTISSTALPGFVQQFQEQNQQQQPKFHQAPLDFQIKVDNTQEWLSNPHQQQASNEYTHDASIPPNHVVFATNNSNEQVAQNIFGVKYDALRYNLDRVHIPPITPTTHWCTINYYELDTQIGQTFKVHRDQVEVTVDGGMDPSGIKSNRFCLGALPNVHRSEASEKARIHIGRGIKLRCMPDGSVYLNCLSLKGVFVRSYFLDFEHGLVYGSTVHKFCVGAEKKIFDLRWAFAEMCEQRQSAQMAVAAQAFAVAGIAQNTITPSLNLVERAGTGVDDLRRVCCTIAISFVKGWGTGYNRSTIKETPCWIELQLHRPLQLLNSLLRKTD